MKEDNMKITHYSREGYEGAYTYNSVCGKSVKTHQDNEDSDIDPRKTTCEDCLKSEKFTTDLSAWNSTNEAIKNRLYLESDILQADEFRSAQREVSDWCKENGEEVVDRVFSVVLNFAWHRLDEVWKYVLEADEIYATSSLMSLCGGYTGAPVIFDKMCENALKANISGKKVIILNNLKYIQWGEIDIHVMKKVFSKNDLIMYNDEYELVKVDVNEIKP